MLSCVGNTDVEARVTRCVEKSIVIIIASKVQGSTYKPQCKMNYNAAYISPPLAQAPMSRFPIRPVPMAVTIGGPVVNYTTEPPPEKTLSVRAPQSGGAPVYSVGRASCRVAHAGFAVLAGEPDCLKTSGQKSCASAL